MMRRIRARNVLPTRRDRSALPCFRPVLPEDSHFPPCCEHAARSFFALGMGQLGRLPMTIKASGRSALILATGLFVGLLGGSYTTAPTEAATSKTETVTATSSVKQGSRHLKRYAHRKHSGTALKSSASTKEAEKDVGDASGDVPATITPTVANANALL